VERDEPFETRYRRIFAEEYARLFRHLARLTGEPEAAADHAQEALLRLYQRGAWPLDVRAWLVSVAHNLVRDAHRAKRRRGRLLDEKAPLLEPASPEAPDVALAARERRKRVRRALERISERDRHALLLRHEGYSYREIAAALDYASTGIGKLLVRASRAFRAAYEEGEPDARS